MLLLSVNKASKKLDYAKIVLELIKIYRWFKKPIIMSVVVVDEDPQFAIEEILIFPKHD